MGSDQHAPIELSHNRSTSAEPTRGRRLPGRLLVSVVGLSVAATTAMFVADGGGVNLETASRAEPVNRATDPTGDDPESEVDRRTLVVRSVDGAAADVMALDDGGVAFDESAPATPGSVTSLGSGESADARPDATTTDSPVGSRVSNDSTPTSSSGNPDGKGGRTSSTAARNGTTVHGTTSQRADTLQTTTTQRLTTATPAVNVNGPVVWVDSRAAGGGDGSQARPFRTINDGILAVRAGETLMVRGGEYREHVNPGYRMPRGTSSSPITMTNAPGERVVIKGRVILTDLDHWTIRGINVTWDADRNDRSVEHLIILNGGVGWEWRDSEIWGAKAYSAMLITKDPRNFAVRNNHIHDTYRTNDTNQDHLIYCACGTGGGTIERNLLVGSPNGRAIKLGGSNSSGAPVGNVTIRYNTMVDNYGPSNIQLSFDTSTVTMERNIMVGSQSYAENISTWKLTGSGSRAANNLGFKSPGVLERHGGISDGGGNIHRDPRLDSNYVPRDSTAKAYGHKAP